MAATAPIKSRYAGEDFVLAKPAADLLARVCPSCECGDGRELGVKNDLPLIRCRQCGTAYTSYQPWYTSEDFYSGYYPRISDEPEFVKMRLGKTIESFAPYRRTNRLLDIGCGTGALLKVAEDAGWEVQGLDVSRVVVEHGQRNGLNVLCGEIEQAGFETGSFDVITASELLEHLPNPKSLVTEVARVIRPGGLFWTTTPHARGLSARVLGLKWSVLCPPEHLQLFSISGISRLLHSAGFREISIRTEGTNPFEFVNVVGSNAPTVAVAEKKFDRVESTYQLNESLMKGKFRRLLKSTANEILNSSRLGDSIKIRAVR